MESLVRKFVSITPMVDEEGKPYLVFRRYHNEKYVGEAILEDCTNAFYARRAVEEFRNM